MPEEPPRVTADRRVLIVEDEPKLRAMLERAVRDMDFDPTSAESAERGLEELEAADYSIVLSDLNLPGMHGLEFCRVVRDRWPNTQILILTGHGDLDAARTAIRLDVVDFLTKPCSLGDLEIALDRALRRRRHHVIPHVIPSEDEDGPPDDAPWTTPATSRRLEDIEREHILDVIAHVDGNREAAASELGISVRTLYYRLKQYAQQGAWQPEADDRGA